MPLISPAAAIILIAGKEGECWISGQRARSGNHPLVNVISWAAPALCPDMRDLLPPPAVRMPNISAMCLCPGRTVQRRLSDEGGL